MKPNHRSRSIAIALAFACLMSPHAATSPWAATLNTKECAVASSNCTIGFSGRIGDGDYQAVKRALEASGKKAPFVRVTINSGGGSLFEAMEIGRLLRQMEAAIYIGSDSQCSSACVMLIAGAPYRQIFGKVGIHRPFDNRPRALSQREAQEDYVRLVKAVKEYLTEMNITDRLYDAMMAVPSNGVRFLSSIELGEFGLTNSDPAITARDDARSALLYNVSVVEYYARRQRADSQCGEVLTPKLGFEKWLRCRQTILFGIPYQEIERRKKQMSTSNCDDATSEEAQSRCLVDAFWK